MKYNCNYSGGNSDGKVVCLENKDLCNCVINGIFDESKVEKCPIKKYQDLIRNPSIIESFSELQSKLPIEYPKTYKKFRQIISENAKITPELYVNTLIELGMYPHIVPELYEDGINWNWQVLWYEKNKPRIGSGTFFYGDNNEYPTYNIAVLSYIDMSFGLLELGLEVISVQELTK